MNVLNCREYIEAFLKIRDKDGHAVPFRLNQPQRKLYGVIREQWAAGKPVRIIILKARQMGFSTLTEGILYWFTATTKFVESMVVAHTDEATGKIFRMSSLFYELSPPQIRPQIRASNAQELFFDKPARSRSPVPGLKSRLRCATAGGQGVGRGSTIQALHMSEYAFWPGQKNETYTGLMQAVPDRPGTIVIIESTANGYDDFKQKWDAAVEAQARGEDGFIPVFFAWHEMAEYRRPVPPGFQRTDEEEQLAQTYNLDDEQLAWRRWCIRTNCGGDVNLFRQEYPATPDEAFLATGSCVFDKDQIVLQRERVKDENWERGSFAIKKDLLERIESWRWVPDKAGCIRIRKHPEAGVPYVIGGDTAGTGSDSFVGQVLDNRTGEQVAVLQQAQMGEREYAEQMYCMGHYYNEALIGIETNYSTYPEKKLEELGYKKLYVRQRIDTFTGATVDAFGFETTSSSRPVIIDGLKDVAAHSLQLITDYATLGEMLTFIYNDKYRPEAEQGEHDDLVMALAIAHYIRSQQTTQQATKKKRTHWTQDMWEDYRAASQEERKHMIAQWGDPE